MEKEVRIHGSDRNESTEWRDSCRSFVIRIMI